MSEANYRVVAGPLGTLFRVGVLGSLSDAALLHRFLDGGAEAEAAFEALVSRHGPLVLGTCRRLLRDEHEAADAFQATFLVLVKRAGAVRHGDSLGPWLYGVARRVAIRHKSESTVRRTREARAAIELSASLEPEPPQDDPYAPLYAEIDRLPEKYRSPVVLCHLQGRTIDDASRQLGWPVGTVAGRLARARGLLRTRLARRGFAPGAVAAATEFLAPKAQAAVPPGLLLATVKSAACSSVGNILTGPPELVSRQAVALSEGVLHAMTSTKLKSLAASLAIAGSLITAVGVFARQAGEARPAQPQTGGPGKSAASTPRPASPTLRASASAGVRPAGKNAGGVVADINSTRLVNIAKLGPIIAASDRSPRTKEALAKLEEPVTMSFSNETPLEDVLKYIKNATTGPKGGGLQFYIDPIGLSEVERTVTSPISLDLEGIPLKTTLRLLLKQIGLAYCVKDGLVIISSPKGIVLELNEAATDEQRDQFDYRGGFP